MASTSASATPSDPGASSRRSAPARSWLEIVDRRGAPRASGDRHQLQRTRCRSSPWPRRARPELEVVGLCHSVQGTSRQLAALPGHSVLTEITLALRRDQPQRVVHHGSSVAARTCIRCCASGRMIPEIYEQDPVRFEVMLHLGAFVTESSGHFSEYVPYFRKRPDLRRRSTREPGYLGESGFYASNWPRVAPGKRRARSTLDARAAETPDAHSSAATSTQSIDRGGHRGLVARRPSTATCSTRGWIDNLPARLCRGRVPRQPRRAPST